MNISRIKGLDGLRVFAIVFVLLYHFHPTLFPGGFLGVDLFFVLSGFLITFMLYSEYKNNGKIKFKSFYKRRVKRILPALWFMIIIVMLYLYFTNTILFNEQTNDALFGMLFLSNWFNIFNDVAYFDQFSAAYPFKHLWSIAIEEQFYLFYPLFLSLTLYLSRKKVHREILTIGIISLLSLLTMMLLYNPDNLNTVYYNFFTRFYGFTIGGIFAIIYYKYQDKKFNTLLNSFISLVGILILITMLFVIDENMSFLYNGGLLIIYFIFSTLIFALAQPNNYVTAILETKPFRYLSKRSYSIYLWHYPIIIIFLTPTMIGKQSIFITILLTILTILIAEFSYRYIENPLRHNKWHYNMIPRRTMTIIYVLVFLCVTSIIVSPKNQTVAENTYDNSDVYTSIYESFTSIMPTPEDVKAVTDNYQTNRAIREEEAQKKSSIYEQQVILIGDSISLNYQDEFTEDFNNVIYDAEVGRQSDQVPAVAQNYSQYNNPNTIVILNIGTNGEVYKNELEAFIEVFDQCQIYLVNTAVDKSWAKQANKNIATVAEKYDNVYLVDWKEQSNNHPEYFGSDGIHLTNSGSEAMVALIENTITSTYNPN